MYYPSFVVLWVIYIMCATESVFACVPRPERGRGIVLNGDPKGKNMVYTNGHTVVIRDIAVSVTGISNKRCMYIVAL